MLMTELLMTMWLNHSEQFFASVDDFFTSRTCCHPLFIWIPIPLIAELLDHSTRKGGYRAVIGGCLWLVLKNPIIWCKPVTQIMRNHGFPFTVLHTMTDIHAWYDVWNQNQMGHLCHVNQCEGLDNTIFGYLWLLVVRHSPLVNTSSIDYFILTNHTHGY